MGPDTPAGSPARRFQRYGTQVGTGPARSWPLSPTGRQAGARYPPRHPATPAAAGCHLPAVGYCVTVYAPANQYIGLDEEAVNP
ncbi:hypothetical protein OG582_39040 (plasmid) [Streptomyces anulatus]|uniref:hypothetical protein n=1 Tax=Streptomyces anulatus TaxID=1892 RepID=UPI0032559BDF